MIAPSCSWDVRELRDQLADARSLALQLQRELEVAHAALDEARTELWRAHAQLMARQGSQPTGTCAMGGRRGR